MNLFGWLKKDRADERSTTQMIAPAEAESTEPTEKEIFASPALLANWVNKWIVKGTSIEDDYSLLPDDETRKRLSITPAQRERCVREYSVLRVAGVACFVKQQYPDSFWLAFLNRVSELLVEHINGDRVDLKYQEIAEAIEQYVDGWNSNDVDLCANTYLKRVYDDNDRFVTIKLGGLGFMACDFIASTYEVFRDAYCKVTQGMSFESVKAINEALEKVKAEKAQQNTPADAAKPRG